MSQTEEKAGFDQNFKTFIALLYKAGGVVKGHARLRLGMYALKGYGLHNYKFEDRCQWGPEDSKFQENLQTYGGFIKYGSYDDEHEIFGKERSYELTKGGETFGRVFSNEIQENNPDGYERLKAIASVLKMPPGRVPTQTLFELYAAIDFS